MVTYTSNKGLAQPLNSSYFGGWDVPMNANSGIIDASFGGIASLALTNASVTLSTAQAQNAFLTFTSSVGGLSANITIYVPSIGAFYTVQNLTTNTSIYTVTVATTLSSGQAIAIPPGEPTDIMVDGVNVKFRALGRVGTYWDYAGSSVPAWVSACTVPPYLNCDGTSFSSATYPVLATILGGTTLPDSKGRVRATLDQGSARITTAIPSTSVGASGGDQNFQNHYHVVALNDPGHAHAYFTSTNHRAEITDFDVGGGAGGGYPGSQGGNVLATATNSTTTGITIGNGSNSSNITGTSTGGGSGYNLQPTYVGGLTLIRSG